MMTAGTEISVLHVDDDSGFRDLTATYLEQTAERLTVETAADADAGLERLAKGSFDCVVSDYNMAGRDGIEFLDAVRETHAELPFILFTGKGSEEVAAEAISAGATDYIQKSGGSSQYTVLANRITNVVETYWANHRLEQANQRRRRTLERITDGFVELDGDLVLTDVNEQAVEFADIPRDEQIGTDYRALLADESDAAFLSAYEEVQRTGEPTTVVARSDLRPERWIEERIFPAEDGDGIFVYFRDVTEEKNQERLREIIIDVSSRLINADIQEINDGVEAALERIGRFAGADRCYVFEIYDDGARMDNTHEWNADSVEPHKPVLQNLETASFAWFIPRIRARETVTVPNAAELPPEADTLESTLEFGDIESIVTVPMAHGETLHGFIGLDWLDSRDPWSEDTVALLEICGNIIASAFVKKETIREPNSRERELE